MQTKNGFKAVMKKQNPLKPMTKVLTIIQSKDDYCQFMRLMYATGYKIHYSKEHPRAITLPQSVIGYIEKRDAEAKCYKFVIYGHTRRHRNARVVYLIRQ